MGLDHGYHPENRHVIFPFLGEIPPFLKKDFQEFHSRYWLENDVKVRGLRCGWQKDGNIEFIQGC